MKGPHYNTCLEGILATMGENGEREISWNFDRNIRTPRAITNLELGTKDTLKVVWELRIRNELEEEGWTTCYTDGSGLDEKASGAFTRNSHTGLHENKSGTRYLGTRATHHDGELSGIAQALEESREVNLLAILTDSKLAISTIRKLNSGEAPPRSEIEARISGELCKRSQNNLDTGLAWVKGHKGIEGNEKADQLCREAAILGHESEGVVTPAGLRAWSRRVRVEARGGNGEGILGWHRRAISAYTWCITEKGPQKEWLHHIKKADTTKCACRHHQQTGKHLAEECNLLADARNSVRRREMSMWNTRHLHRIPGLKEKGPVKPEKENEKETDELELFFCQLFDFYNPVPAAPAFVPEVVPAAVPSPIPYVNLVASAVSPISPVFVASAIPSSVSTDNPAISSVNFVPPIVSSSSCIVSSPTCIEPTA